MENPLIKPTPDDWKYLAQRRKREAARLAARSPKPIGKLLARLTLRRGYGRTQSVGQIEMAWKEAVGEYFAGCTRAGGIRRSVLRVTVNNSAAMQNLVYAAPELIAKMKKLLPDTKIEDIKFRVGATQ
jgi:predicted nucleic acid-binding Zn ribbon protein